LLGNQRAVAREPTARSWETNSVVQKLTAVGEEINSLGEEINSRWRENQQLVEKY